MKPLELTIYDKHPDADAYRVGGFYSPYCLVSKDKRFSEAELAAEYWRAGNEWRADESLRAILDRFATLPHYDEADQ